ncbi:hypothetical protein C8C84_3089 [Flavobacterium sp. 102]|nr:hypothetical protein C8C84_3089 [Flavobacterium sp. 102]
MLKKSHRFHVVKFNRKILLFKVFSLKMIFVLVKLSQIN